MQLHSLYVENYRAIRKGQLTFDDSIAIIGENDSGKSSLLDALNKVLNPSNVTDELVFGTRHFYHENKDKLPAGGFRISLEFIEKQVGEWSKDIYKPIHGLFKTSQAEKHKLILELRARLNNDNKVSVSWEVRNPQAKIVSSDSEIINWLRIINPIILLSAGMLTGHGIDNLSGTPLPMEKNTFPEELQKHIKTVQNSAFALLSRKSTHIHADIDSGYDAACKLNNYLTQLPGFDGIKLTIGAIEDTGNSSILRTGSNSEKLGALLLMYALIRACGQTSLKEVDPIWVLEDPEAHLHKITLASVSNIISGIKGQKVITTNSGGLLATVPLLQVRRLIRNRGTIQEYFVKEHTISQDDIRRINYHVRTHRNSAFFSRLWLLVEGETEFWILPRMARLLGYDFRLEGITCVEFAQSGLRPLIKVADQMNIQWLMLSDGDKAGYKYASQAANFLQEQTREEKICIFPARDIEQYLWQNGFAEVYIKHARTKIERDRLNPSRTIKQAIRNYSKPHLALKIIEAAAEKGAANLPLELVKLIENCVVAARKSVEM